MTNRDDDKLGQSNQQQGGMKHEGDRQQGGQAGQKQQHQEQPREGPRQGQEGQEGLERAGSLKIQRFQSGARFA